VVSRKVWLQEGCKTASESTLRTPALVPQAKHGFTLYEPHQMRGLLEDAGFGAVRMVPGTGRRGDFVCAIGTKSKKSA
jgi:hypothetical protein